MSGGILAVAAAAVTAALCGAVVRRGAPEVAVVLSLAAGAWVLLLSCSALWETAAYARELAELAGLDATVVSPVLKTVGISLMTRLTAEICRGAGEGGVAAAVETAGTLLALAVALPLAREVVSALWELLA